MVDRPIASAVAPLSGARRRLVEELKGKGIVDPAVLRAIELTPRHAFVPSGVRHRAYEDGALPIGSGQTISQPFVHARSLELLRLTGSERVLEVGTGSGYQTALLSKLALVIYSVERVEALLRQAEEALRVANVSNVYLAVADGTAGWREHAPFDAIVVGAGSPEIPQPLVDQLADGGRLLVPVGDRDVQRLVLVERKGTRVLEQAYDPVRFVPLVGDHGWAE
ncbi:MAG: protein-L-isoaspartate(D-aspartate) O-methyltransferase [Gemmatimonadetes bacterium]|nr:protein-L-isoaspartate(D-aspartate) O-methyltransferase [Gemmatimonadota bacterium]